MIKRNFILCLYGISFSLLAKSSWTCGQLLKKSLPFHHAAFFLPLAQCKARIISLKNKGNPYCDFLQEKGFSPEELEELVIIYEKISHIEYQLKNRVLMTKATKEQLIAQENQLTHQKEALLRKNNIINPNDREKITSVIKQIAKINHEINELSRHPIKELRMIHKGLI